jgi:hypothetical protein
MQKQKNNIIDCSSDPYDLSAPAERILGDLKNRLKQKTDKKPIILLLGERHTVTPSVILPQAVMAAAIKQNIAFSYSIEFPHNSARDLSHYLHSKYNADERREISMDTLMRYVISTEAHEHTMQNEFAFLLKNSLTPCFCDAARDLMELDLSDSLTRKFIEQAEPNSVTKSRLFNNDIAGMHVRNQMMVDLGLKHMRAEGMSILIQRVGAAHVAGDDLWNRYPESMMGLYEKKGCNVIGTMMERDGLKYTVAQDEPLNDNILFIRGWEDINTPEKRNPEQRSEIEKISQASKGLVDLFNPTDTERKYLENTVRKRVQGESSHAPKP